MKKLLVLGSLLLGMLFPVSVYAEDYVICQYGEDGIRYDIHVVDEEEEEYTGSENSLEIVIDDVYTEEFGSGEQVISFSISDDKSTEEKVEESKNGDVSSSQSEYQPTEYSSSVVDKANSYMSLFNFSYEELVDQLVFEGYDYNSAVNAADYVDRHVVWDFVALKRADNYLDCLSFSYAGLIDQLEFDKFTEEQAFYAANYVDVDWYEQALNKAISYQNIFNFSYEKLVKQLEYDKFTSDQARYAANVLFGNYN